MSTQSGHTVWPQQRQHIKELDQHMTNGHKAESTHRDNVLQHVHIGLPDVDSHGAESKAEALGAALQHDGGVEVPGEWGHVPIGRAVTGAGAGAPRRGHLGQHKVLCNNQGISVTNSILSNNPKNWCYKQNKLMRWTNRSSLKQSLFLCYMMKLVHKELRQVCFCFFTICFFLTPLHCKTKLLIKSKEVSTQAERRFPS